MTHNSTANGASPSPISSTPVNPEDSATTAAGLRYTVRRVQFDRPGSRHAGTRHEYHVFDGHVWLICYHSRAQAERHVAGLPVITRTRQGFVLWIGAQFDIFDTPEEARRAVRQRRAA